MYIAYIAELEITKIKSEVAILDIRNYSEKILKA